jgi:molybdate transport system ATP-binding protein
MLMDEPLSSLDREHKQQILGLIQQVRDALHIPMLYVSHDLTELLQLTDRLLVIDGGRTVGHGPLREVIQHAGAWKAMHDLGPANLLKVTVTDHDGEAGLTKLALDVAQDRFLVGPLNRLPKDDSVHVSIPPEDIALALARVPDVSIQNQLPGRIVEITRHADRSIAAVDIGESLLVEVSHRTVKAMELAPGREIWCLIKSNAITYVG